MIKKLYSVTRTDGTKMYVRQFSNTFITYTVDKTRAKNFADYPTEPWFGFHHFLEVFDEIKTWYNLRLRDNFWVEDCNHTFGIKTTLDSLKAKEYKTFDDAMLDRESIARHIGIRLVDISVIATTGQKD